MFYSYTDYDIECTADQIAEDEAYRAWLDAYESFLDAELAAS